MSNNKKIKEKLLYQDVFRYRRGPIQFGCRQGMDYPQKSSRFTVKEGIMMRFEDRRWVFDEVNQKRITAGCHDEKQITGAC